MYTPKPLDTSRVGIDPELRALVERLAEHRHDVWARDRIREGWTFGRARDEALKTHPGLVPYAELPEPERECERRAALEVIQAILALGLTIRRPEAHPRGPEVRERVESVGAVSVAEGLPGVRQRVEELLGMGEPLLACEAIETALARWPRDLRLRQLRGLALARSGATERANQAMHELSGEGHGDGETLGILARTHKDLAERAATRAQRAAHLERAYLAYRQGYDGACRLGNAEDAYFTGINAATLSLLTGEAERASGLAREVRALCRQELSRCPHEPSYWLHATLAEAALLLGERAEAEEQYGRAAERAGARYADLSTTRRQARLVLSQRGEDPGWVEDILRVPPLAIFTGHMIDRPGRETARFPAEREGAVARAILERVRRVRPAAGYASAACGSDILFLEALLDERREFHVVLPFAPGEFLRTSVQLIPGSDWGQRFDRVLAAAASVTTASDHPSSDDASSFDYANLILTGMAALHARRLETELVGLAVWDGQTGDGPGGTGSLVEQWQSRGLAVERIDPAAPEREEEAGPRPRAALEPLGSPKTDATDELPHQLMALLFADAVGYSGLREDQIPLFVEHFLAPVAELIERSPQPPILKETAGDGFYFVFRRVCDAGRIALALQDLVSQVDWEACGLPPTMGLRVALHCGPVQRLIDPISGQPKYTGPHTSRGARIEPITPPGQVYSSQAFAAVAAATGVEDLAFDYVGRTALAKRYGSLALYHVRRR